MTGMGMKRIQKASDYDCHSKKVIAKNNFYYAMRSILGRVGELSLLEKTEVFCGGWKGSGQKEMNP